MRKESFLKRKKLSFLIVYVYMSVGAHRGQKRMSDSLGLMVVTLTDGCECPIQIKVLLASEPPLLTTPHAQYLTSPYQAVPTSLVRSPSVGFLSQACWSVCQVSCCGQVLCKRSHAPPAVSLKGWQSRVRSLDRKFYHVCLRSSSSHHSSALSTFSCSAPPDRHIPPRPSMLASSQMNQPLLFLLSKWIFPEV